MKTADPAQAAAFLRAFAAARGEAVSERVDEGALEERLTAAHEKARRRWSPVVLGPLPFASHAGRCAGALDGADPLAALDGLHLDDLYLAVAVAEGVEHAADRFASDAFSLLGAYLAPIVDAPSAQDEVRQIVLQGLVIPDADGTSRLLQYGARAPLAAWVGVAAARAALDLVRADATRRRTADQAAREPMTTELDPELRYLKQRYRGAFEAALEAAIAELPPRDRAIFRLQAGARLSLARIAPLFGVDESTVSRWMARARRQLLERTQQRLAETLGTSESEFGSLARLVVSQLDVSVARLLGSEARSPADAGR